MPSLQKEMIENAPFDFKFLFYLFPISQRAENEKWTFIAKPASSKHLFIVMDLGFPHPWYLIQINRIKMNKKSNDTLNFEK